jgi:hypothetical protein
MGKAVLHFQVPVEIECPFLSRPSQIDVACSKGLMCNNLEYCINCCTVKDKKVNVKSEDSKLKRGDKSGIRLVGS